MKLLIVEDEVELSAALKKGFIKKGFAVDCAFDGLEGEYLALTNDYDVILLDLNLPYKDGLDVLDAIRKQDPSQKIIILSARASVVEKIAGLDKGANDYVAKPFDFLELEARVRSLARRKFIQMDSIVALHGMVLDTAKKTVHCHGEGVELAPKEFAILEYLVLHRGKTIRAEELIEHVWDSEVDLFSGSLKVHISNLRRKLEPKLDKPLIKTVRGLGYLIEEGAPNVE